MEAPQDINGLFRLYESRGGERYGEALSQTEHALQCAWLASEDNASDELVAAALFHDVGHLAVGIQNAEGFALDKVDDDHEAVGARVLAPLLGPAVAQSVSLHVTAKRWRCTIEPAYLKNLSAASRATLQAQGGLLNDQECRRFEEHPGFEDALNLRAWDDRAKIEDLNVGSLADYETLVTTLAAEWSRGRRAR